MERESLERIVLDLLDRIQPYLRHIPDVTHTEIEELRERIRRGEVIDVREIGGA